MVRMARFAFDDDQDADDFGASESLADWDEATLDVPPANATEKRHVSPNRPGTRRVTSPSRCGHSSPEPDGGSQDDNAA